MIYKNKIRLVSKALDIAPGSLFTFKDGCFILNCDETVKFDVSVFQTRFFPVKPVVIDEIEPCTKITFTDNYKRLKK